MCMPVYTNFLYKSFHGGTTLNERYISAATCSYSLESSRQFVLFLCYCKPK